MGRDGRLIDKQSLRGRICWRVRSDHGQQERSNGLGGWVVEDELFSEQVQIERKLFSFDLRENPRGLFLKVTEDVGGRRDAIIIPATGLLQFQEILGRAINAHAGHPQPATPAAR